ncbi:Borealin N terminal-domain-containing protein [Fusarium acuminatum]|uniref:Borealin N terminal-domain-containing protein n=1 Tax=Fusarium acuminatum TaxID=5515 RepID=A0ABZ2WII9_9HYPO
MSPVRSRKTNSDDRPASPTKSTMAERVPTQTGSPSAQPRSPIRKRSPGAITMQQKQAMIDNMQLEITERARRLRAQYNYMATTVRSRIEMRLNRVPMSMRNVKMGDLLQKCIDQEQQRAARSTALMKPPTIRRGTSPTKQTRPAALGLKPPPQQNKRMSDAISGDKENDLEHNQNAQKRVRANTDATHVRPGQILSPTSSNSRMANQSRPASPTKSSIARPASPLKNSTSSRTTTASNMLSSMVDKAKASRAGASRKLTTTSTTSSSTAGSTAATRNKQAPGNTASRGPASRPATRTGRRSIANSESSEASSGTVVRKGATSRNGTAKKGTTGSTRKGATTGAVRKTTTKTSTASTGTGTGRVLRKRA